MQDSNVIKWPRSYFSGFLKHCKSKPAFGIFKVFIRPIPGWSAANKSHPEISRSKIKIRAHLDLRGNFKFRLVFDTLKQFALNHSPSRKFLKAGNLRQVQSFPNSAKFQGFSCQKWSSYIRKMKIPLFFKIGASFLTAE